MTAIIDDIVGKAKRDLFLWFDNPESDFDLKGNAWLDGYVRGYMKAVVENKERKTENGQEVDA